jgi:hypothetical protein
MFSHLKKKCFYDRRTKIREPEQEPIAKSLSVKLGHTDIEVEKLKKKLQNASEK